MWDLLQDNISEETLLSELKKEYNITDETALQALNSFINFLDTNNLLE